MPERGNALSRNPNVCASCSSLLDGMDADQPQPADDAAEAMASPQVTPDLATPDSIAA